MKTTLYVLAAVGLIVFGLAPLTYRPGTPPNYAPGVYVACSGGCSLGGCQATRVPL